ncbi:tetratricopeptide repeat protein [Fluviicola sp.]|jgi:DNA-binding CsgD family transcriptional regulator|uniref:tetratricopeptide repeat protein n=1 Tax=Fluviicola sp. TaxID=1917219 RepID=UPI00263237D9|nr:tetratricopeptide repeat protein [Fluviicola sp.]
MSWKMTLFTALLLLFLPGSGLCQKRAEDSLVKRLQQVGGKEKIKTLYELGNRLFYVDSSEARKYFSTGLKLAKQSGFRSLEIEGEWSLAGVEDFYGSKLQSLNRLMKLSRSGGFSRRDSCIVFGLIGNSLEALGANEMSIAYSKRSLKHEFNLDRIARYYMIERIARLHSKMHQFDSANFYYRHALNLIKKHNDPGVITHCLNNIGSNYLEQGNLSTARYFFDRAINNFHLNNKYSGDSTLYAVIHDNLARIHELRGEYKQSLEKQKEAVRMITIAKLAPPDLKLRTQFLLHLAKLESHYGLLEEAKKHLDAVKLKDADTKLRLEYYDVLCTYYERTHQPGKLIEALRKRAETASLALKDGSINSRLNDFVRFQNDQITLELETQKKAQQRLQSINRKERLLGIGSVAILLIILIVVFIVNRKVQQSKNQAARIERKLNEEKLKYQELEAERLTLELELKNKDLLTFAINLTKKFEFTDEMALRLQQLRRKNAIEKGDVTELITYVKSFQAVDNGLALFQNNVNEINSQFLWRLHEKYPELTQNEKELCLLIKLKLSSKDIATMKSITPESVNVLRSRLRKKMNLDARDELYTILEDI